MSQLHSQLAQLPGLMAPQKAQALIARQQNEKNPLLALPPEIRNSIWELAYEADTSEEVPLLQAQASAPTQALILTCTVTYKEANCFYKTAYQHFWRTTPFFIIDSASAEITSADLDRIACADFEAVAYLTIYMSGRECDYKLQLGRTHSKGLYWLTHRFWHCTGEVDHHFIRMTYRPAKGHEFYPFYPRFTIDLENRWVLCWWSDPMDWGAGLGEWNGPLELPRDVVRDLPYMEVELGVGEEVRKVLIHFRW